MVAEQRRRTARPLLWLGVVLAAGAALVVLCWWAQRLFIIEGETGEAWRLNPIVPAALVAGGFAMLALRLMLQKRVDPNRGYPATDARSQPGAVMGIPGKASAQMLERH
jgi:hypothetical protein